EELDDVPGELGRLVDLRGTGRDPLARERTHELADLALLVGERVDRHGPECSRARRSARARTHANRRELAVAGVVEDRRVAARAPVLEPERAVVDFQVLRDQLLALLLVARDDAGHRCLVLDRTGDPDAEGVADAEPLPPRGVVDLDLRRPDGDEVARLAGPGKVLDLRPVEPGEEEPRAGRVAVAGPGVGPGG